MAAIIGLVCVLAIRLASAMKKELRRWFYVLSFGCCAIGIMLFLEPINRAIEHARLSRIGMLTMTVPDFLGELSWATLLGVGCDPQVVLAKVNSYRDAVHLLIHATDTSAFGDVFWVAMLVYHGILGLGIALYLFLRLYRAQFGNDVDPEYNQKYMFTALYSCIFIWAFFNQVFLVRPFALIFWVLLALCYVRTHHAKEVYLIK
jgi:hypothetical protein